jgi:AcrR family transcriptional regulator
MPATPDPADDAERQRLERKAARQARRKDEIVRAAAELVVQVGLEGFTADDVARALGMSTPSVFYYFPGGLAELRAAVAVRRFHERSESTLRAVADAPSGVAALTTLLRGFVQSYADDPDGMGKDLEIMMKGAWGPELVQLHITKLNALFTVIEQKLAAEQAAGAIHPDVTNLRRIAMLMNQLGIGLIVGDQMIRKVGGGSKHALAALLDDLCGLIERGVGVGGVARTTTSSPSAAPRSRSRPRRKPR